MRHSYPSNLIQERESAIRKVLEKYVEHTPPSEWDDGVLYHIANKIECMLIKEFTPTGHGGGGAPYKLERRTDD